jgi:[acyl-carrier-protein] S-malonyltransferase
MSKQSAVVICPGRGTYNSTELGYLKRYHACKSEWISTIDHYREQCGQPLVSELDNAATYRASTHTTGDNASALIYTCAQADFLSIDREQFDIVAVTGNSMGWYIALACAGALPGRAAFDVINTMGTLMHKQAPGGQLIYPLVNEQWQTDPALKTHLDNTLAELSDNPELQIYPSIDLGGLVVLAGNKPGIKALQKNLAPVQDRYPLVLPHHGAFHSPLMQEISDQAKSGLAKELFQLPQCPLIDGRGKIWAPYATDLDALYDYTLAHQIYQPYDYSSAIEVAIKEFAPDKLILLGPGSTLGAPTAQTLIAQQWLGLGSKSDFVSRQKSDPFVLSMGIDDQRVLTRPLPSSSSQPQSVITT